MLKLLAELAEDHRWLRLMLFSAVVQHLSPLDEDLGHSWLWHPTEAPRRSQPREET